MGAPNMARRATAGVELGGAQVAAGDRVLLSCGAARRDPAICPRPHDIDLRRSTNRYLALGAGNHSCIGASLARLILRDGYETWLSRIPDFSVAEGFEPDYETGNTRHMLALPLCFPVGVAPN